MGSVVLLIGSLGVILYALWQIARAVLALRWPQTDGTISRTALVSPRDPEVASTSEYVTYRYSVEGQPFVGDRLRFGPQVIPTSLRPAPIGDSVPTQSVGLVHPLRPGMAVRVHYNPRNPADSVLWLAPAWTVWVLLATGLLFAYQVLRSGTLPWLAI